MSDTATHDGAFLGSVFSFEIDGLAGVNMFTACSGLSLEFDVIKHDTILAGKTKIERKMPGRPKYSEVVLKRGLTSNKDLHDWFKQVTDGAVETPYKTATIVVIDRIGNRVANFSLESCWPSKLTVSDLSSGSDDVMIEELTIQHEFLDWKPGS